MIVSILSSPLVAVVAFMNIAYTTGSLNIYGHELASCSQNGMALTGFMRDGYCVEEEDDEGSHHICIDLSSTTGGNFCQVTGQDNWCNNSEECHGDSSSTCPIQNWCVCQWAFATYIKKAGGCDQIQDIVCEAINMEALYAYGEKRETDEDIDAAFDCIERRCFG
ncbi:unnamed protein product [Pseudo-nitzschia multistriata]|uniref:Lysozyme n=1 Tax=Pseudo-nitzschia multistriata TaxID=183589 RepID=A0A448ZIF4_9STRA|nr:unnamed protein product [Pseudo-nitzschia multistriata]